MRNLLYIGDVPIEATHSGSILLWRLIEKWNPSEFFAIESNLKKSNDTEVGTFQRSILKIPGKRLLKTRFHRFFSSLLMRYIPLLKCRVGKLHRGFVPEAILTVAHDYSFFLAVEYAKKIKVPCYIIVHDDWPTNVARMSSDSSVHDRFGNVLRQCDHYFCVSDGMYNSYQKMYGGAASVLYPSRAVQTNVRETPARLKNKKEKLKIAYAGSCHSYFEVLVELAKIVVGGQLGEVHLYSHDAPAVDSYLITVHEPLPSAYLIDELHEQYDLLFSPQSFEDAQLRLMETNFPSKLVDYSSSGIPCLIWGPSTSSSVIWAGKHQLQYVIDKNDSSTVLSMLCDLLDNPTKLFEEGVRFSEAGNLSFDGEYALKHFKEVVS